MNITCFSGKAKLITINLKELQWFALKCADLATVSAQLRIFQQDNLGSCFSAAILAESECFRVAFITATVQVNIENVTPDILSLIFSFRPLNYNTIFRRKIAL